MSWFLYRLGRWSFRHRWAVIAGWLTALVVAGAAAATLSGPTVDSFTLKGLESTEAFALIKERTPQASPDGATSRIIFEAPAGRTLTEYRAEVDGLLKQVSTPHVAGIASPFETGAISEDGRAGYATVTYNVAPLDLDDADRAAARSIATEGSATDLRVGVSGDTASETSAGPGVAELLGVGVAFIVLVLTLGTLLAAGMSLLTAVVGVGIGVAALTAATGFMALGSTTPILALMLGLAVGIDYALFIVSRHRHELAVGHTPEDAAGRAVGTAGSAVVFAGLTVIVALLGFSLVGITFLTEMGIGAAITVAVAVLIALTLLPAIFGLAGTRLLRSRLPFLRNRKIEPDETAMGPARRWGTFVTRRPLAVLLVGLAAAVALALPLRSMELALPDEGTAKENSPGRVAYDLIAANFGDGANGPLTVVVDTAGAANPREAVEQANAAVGQVEKDVARVTPAGPSGPNDEAAATTFEQQLAATKYAVIGVIPKTGPTRSETSDLVHTLRDKLDSVEAATGATIYVTGQTAVAIDVSQKLSDALPRYLLVIGAAALLLLLLVFRSILVPIKAVLGYIVSIAVALGITTAVAQLGVGSGLIGIDTPGPLLSFFPMLLAGILFGLAMDYELFLVSRMKEEHAHGASAKDAIVSGFHHGGRVVAAAAIIMISVFASFALIDDPIQKTIGIGLAAGVFADAFLVRMILVPAVMSLVGERMWWIPKWLDRILPNLDLEGETLTRRLGRGLASVDDGDQVARSWGQRGRGGASHLGGGDALRLEPRE